MPSRPRRGQLQIVSTLLVTALRTGHAAVLRAMSAAEDGPVGLDPVPHDTAAAMFASRRQRVDRTFEAVERVGRSGHHHIERFIVFVATDFARFHDATFP